MSVFHSQRLLLVILGVTGLILLGIQFVPVDRRPPLNDGIVSAPDPVLEVFRRSCFDCHSNQSVWPWYGFIAPVSWLVEDHILEARSNLNFTRWDIYDEDEQAELVEDIWDEIDLGRMPPDYYLILHPSANLGEHDREIIDEWASQFP